MAKRKQGRSLHPELLNKKREAMRGKGENGGDTIDALSKNTHRSIKVVNASLDWAHHVATDNERIISGEDRKITEARLNYSRDYRRFTANTFDESGLMFPSIGNIRMFLHFQSLFLGEIEDAAAAIYKLVELAPATKHIFNLNACTAKRLSPDIQRLQWRVRVAKNEMIRLKDFPGLLEPDPIRRGPEIPFARRYHPDRGLVFGIES